MTIRRGNLLLLVSKLFPRHSFFCGQEWLEAGKLQRVVLVIMTKATGEVLERWNFRIETDSEVVEKGTFTGAESRAITQYILHTYGKGNNLTFPEDPKKIGLVYLWTEVESQKFDPPAFRLGYELVVKPIFGCPIDEAAVVENEKKFIEFLDVYEARLKESKYLAGDSFTLADLYHLPTLNYTTQSKLKPLFEERTHVNAWAADILARPSWQKVLALQKKLLNN